MAKPTAGTARPAAPPPATPPVRRRTAVRAAVLPLAIGAVAVLGSCSAPAAAPPVPSGTASSAADGSRADGPAEDGPVVLTTFSVLASLVEEIAGDRVEVLSLTKPGVEIHGYEPTPSDLVRLSEASMVLDNGLGLERWFEQFTETLDAERVVLSAGVEPIDIAQGEYSGRPNPHAWMAPSAAALYADNAAAALSRLSPEDAGYFRANAERLKEELDALVDDAAARLPDDAALVTCEGAFSYLARDLGLREHSLWPVNSDVEGTPRQIEAQIEFVRANDVPAVFCESTVDDGAQRHVAEATGAELAGPLYVDSISPPDGPVPDFVSLLRHDLELITDALGTEARP
ncbi:metal ABC transporter solute-binding protein, Zn/Mn family [Zhihengliuella alba]